jgi:hypothetical protein
MIDFINSLPDHVRMMPEVFALIRVVAILFGFQMWEDGSLS